jgi:hypothetical protein
MELALDWIKIELALPDKPEVLRLVHDCKLRRDDVLGKLLRLFAWYNTHLSLESNGKVLTRATIRTITGNRRFPQALIDCGWCIEGENGVLQVANFDRHNSKGAKIRALAAERMTKSRAKRRPVATPAALPPPTRTLPEWLPAETWKAFCEMRQRIRKPLTDHAVGLAIGKLDELRIAGHDVKAVLEQSIINSWQGFGEVKKNAVAPGVKPFAERDYQKGKTDEKTIRWLDPEKT